MVSRTEIVTVGVRSATQRCPPGSSRFGRRACIHPLSGTYKRLHARLKEWTWHTWGIFLALYLFATISTLVAVPHFEHAPLLGLVVAASILAIVNIPRSIYRERPGQAFISSGITLVTLVTLFSVALWPNLVTASNNPEFSLTIFRAASSPKTLKLMLGIALLGMPMVVGYTVIVYWTFRRRVQLGKHSY